MPPQPIVIAVMGPRWSGKTNFINKLTGTKEASHEVKRLAQDVREFTFNLPKGRQYVFVDTPGFDHNYRSDSDILHMIVVWLEKKYRKRVNLSGIIYTHRITDDQITGSVCKNLEMFVRLCGDKAARGVRLVTTMWGKVKNKDVAESRVSQLENDFWKPLIEAGARHKRFEDNSSRCAWAIIETLTGGGEDVLLQEELVQAERKLNETTTGKALYARFHNLWHEQKETIRHLQEENEAQKDPELVKAVEAELRHLEVELQKTSDKIDKLRTPFFRRVAPKPTTIPRFKLLFNISDHAAENDYVIFVVDPTRVEKTSFYRQLSKNDGNGRYLHTKNVEAWRCNLSNGSEKVIIVDTPSFHPDCNGLDAEDRVTHWLDSKFTKKCHSAILFLHSLDSDATSGDMSMSWHLEAFAKTFRNKFTVPSDVYVVPTSNPVSTLPSETLSQRLSQLEIMTERLNGTRERDWHASVFPGVFKGQPETAWSAALLLLKGIALPQTEEFFASPSSAVERMPVKSASARLALEYLADPVFKEFKSKERNRDIDAIIMLGQIALEFIPPQNPQRHSALIDLAGLLSERFNDEGRKEDLEEIISLTRAAPEFTLSDGPRSQTVLLELDDHTFVPLQRANSKADSRGIITLRRAALERIPPPDRCRPLLNLANALREQFQTQGTRNSINEAISLARAAWSLCTPGHPDYVLSQDRLATYLEMKIAKKASRAYARGLDAGPSSCSSSHIKWLIKRVVSDKIQNIPLRLLHTPTGLLCDRDAQISRFEGSRQYEQLLSLASSPDSDQLEAEINNVISEYFEFTMLSHRWGSGEPSLHDVEGRCVYDLDGTDGQVKLQMFCILALQHHFQWAWSDTCCIDKSSSAELQEAIGSMFTWYHQSSLTIVYLPDVFDVGSLVGSVWFTRGWTLQELLAPRAILFYMHDWSLYMKSSSTNHKTAPGLLNELHDATGMTKEHLTNFSPGMADARSRLHWASRRYTTRPEDIAYSLFGIFQVHLPTFYGESAQNALGRLLTEIISRSGDISVLDWVGKPSSFNSCFPADLAPYRMVPRFQPIPSDPAGCNGVDLEKALKLYSKLTSLPRAGFVNSKLILPCIAHPLTAVRLQCIWTHASRYIYGIHASRLRPLSVALSVELNESVDSYILVRPWHSKSFEQGTSGVEPVWKLLEQLEQPFNALLLKRSLRNEYRRIACDCTITACTRDMASILESEVLIPEIV